MSKPDPRRYRSAYKRARAALKAKTKRQGWPCALCRQPFDWSLPYHDGMAWTADHVTPLNKGGHITGTLRPAHRSCNSKRGDASHEGRVPTTRAW